MAHLYNVAPRDGTVIGLMYDNMPIVQALATDDSLKFDVRRLPALGSLGKGDAGVLGILKRAGVATLEDARAKTAVFGAVGASSAQAYLPLIMNKLFGTRFKVIPGYRGTGEIYLAMERGEVDGRCAGLVSSINSTRPDWFPQKKVTVPIVIGFERNPLFPDAPAIAEFAKDEMSLQVLRLLLAPQDMDRPFLVPPGVPKERVAALRTAFLAALNDPGFRADATRMGLEVAEVDGDKAARILNDVYALPAAVVKLAGEAMNVHASASE
jgi:tripartite-type tricarboxylate transporter receptor subunit TctC